MSVLSIGQALCHLSYCMNEMEPDQYLKFDGGLFKGIIDNVVSSITNPIMSLTHCNTGLALSRGHFLFGLGTQKP